MALPRSEAIQKLSIFVSYLDWVRPTDSSHALCGRMRKIIGRILDQILTPSSQVDDAHTMTALSDLELPSNNAVLDDSDFLDWLNTVDWTKGPMMDLG